MFEVAAGESTGLVDPVPLTAMGRFNHEAAAVDPNTGFVYMTEDRGDGALYRFVPEVPGKLFEGGTLQALKVKDLRALNTSNHAAGTQIPVGSRFEVEWVTLQNVSSPGDDLRLQAAAKGAAVFTRGEGMWYGLDSVYFACTDGGFDRTGQVWRLRLNKSDPAGDAAGATLELFIEPKNPVALQNADNLTVSPTGDLFVCEDGTGADFVVGVSPLGQTYRFARNRLNLGEMAGVTFSPDGRWLFVNIQSPGRTLAITGPW